MSVAPKGSLNEVALPRLLLALHDERFDGALHLTSGAGEKRVLIQEGVPVFAETNRSDESLSRRLAAAGRIDEAASLAVRDRAGGDDRAEAVAILELGLLGPREVLDALRDEVRARILGCFAWSQGAWELDPDGAPSEDAHPLQIDVLSLVQSGIAAHWEPHRILGDLEPLLSSYSLGGPDVADFAARLERDEAVDTLVDSLDGSRTLWTLLRTSDTPLALAAAWTLEAVGAIDWCDAPTDSPEHAPSAAPEIEIELESSESPSDVSRPEPRPIASAPEREREDFVLRQAILDTLERLDRMNHYELLGVPEDADGPTLKAAYVVAAKRYHPDAIARSTLDSTTRAQANKVFGEVGKAYAVLTSPERRRSYDSELRGGDSDQDAQRLAQAEGMYRKGEILMRTGNFKGAVELLGPAVDLWPDDGAYRAALGWALYKKLPSEPEAALEQLEEAVSLDPNDPAILSKLAVILRALGRDESAVAVISRARREE